jgi:hypothetical protein
MEQSAVVKETLRIAVPVPAGLPRIVPPAGAVISGVEIPGGVRVSCPFFFVSCLKTVADSSEPEPTFRVVLRGGFRSAARVSSRTMASARL